MAIVLPSQAEIDAEQQADDVRETSRFINVKRAIRAKAWVDFNFIKDNTIYATKQEYWIAIKTAFRDQPWKG